MGGCIKISQIKVASLNFSGIALSPFEYYDDTKQLQILSNLFVEIAQKHVKKPNVEWEVGCIDLKMQKQRYTPIYRDDVCVQNEKLVSRQQFNKSWNKQFQNNKQRLSNYKITSQQIESAKLFDWISYETILHFVYGEKGKNKIDLENIKNLPASEFKTFLKNCHSKPYLDIHQKMLKVKQFIYRHDIDIMFLQQAEIKGDLSWKDIFNDNNYAIKSKQHSESVIIYRKYQFLYDESSIQFENKQSNRINFNNDTVFLKLGNYLLISSHLSSKKQINQSQINEMTQTLKYLKQTYPSLEIILGVDANNKINKNLIQNFYSSTDNQQFQITTIKKRTNMQLQTRKANMLIKQTKDYIITSLKINREHVAQINGKKIVHSLLPNQDHPYDHFIISTVLSQN